MIPQYPSKDEKEYSEQYGTFPYDSGNVGDAHERITNLERTVAYQAKVIDALFVALSMGTALPRPSCPHLIVSNVQRASGSIPISVGECQECFADIARF